MGSRSAIRRCATRPENEGGRIENYRPVSRQRVNPGISTRTCRCPLPVPAPKAKQIRRLRVLRALRVLNRHIGGGSRPVRRAAPRRPASLFLLSNIKISTRSTRSTRKPSFSAGLRCGYSGLAVPANGAGTRKMRIRTGTLPAARRRAVPRSRQARCPHPLTRQGRPRR